MLNKLLVSRMKNADFNIGEQAVLSSILKDFSTLESCDTEVLENEDKSLKQKFGLKASHSCLPNTLSTLRSISNANLLVWGGGHMLQDESSSMDIPYHLLNVFFAQILRIPVILYGVEIGPINTKIGAFFSNKALKRAALILVRNKRSESVLKRIKVDNPNIHVTADPAFLVAPDEHVLHKIRHKYGIENNRPLIGIAPRKAFYKVSGFLPASLRHKLKLLPKDFHVKFPLYKEKIAHICDYLVREIDAQIIFLPMDVGRNQRDDLICKEIIELMVKKKEAVLLEPGMTPSEVAGLIGAMDLVISQRLHALILSCSMNTPMIAISSTGEHDKCRMFMKDTGQINRCFNASALIDETQMDSFFTLVNETWGRREDIKKELDLKARELKAKSSMNIEYVRRWLNNHS